MVLWRGAVNDRSGGQIDLCSAFTRKNAENTELKKKKIFWKILKSRQHHRKMLLKSFHLNGYTVDFYPQTEKLEPPCTA